MSEAFARALAVAAGAGLGAVFFGGLWWTVRLAVASRWAPLWFAGSLLARTALALAGFYAVSAGGRLDRLLLGLLGFVLARAAVTRLTRTDKRRPGLAEEV